MANSLADLLMVSPVTEKPLGFWNVGNSPEGKLLIGLGDKAGDEFWILETFIRESSEIEVKGLKKLDPSEMETREGSEAYYKAANANSLHLFGGALQLLKEAGMSPGSKALLEAADRWADACKSNVKAHAPLPAEAHVDHGVRVVITGNHRNRAAGRGCHGATCSASFFGCDRRPVVGSK